MKVGVVIPVYNGLPYLAEMMQSVATQTYPCRAYVADDCSTDDTPEALARFGACTTRLPKRSGWPEALNAAADLAISDGCDAIFVGAADDWLSPECIARLVWALPGRDFVLPLTQTYGFKADHALMLRNDATLIDFLWWPPITDKALIPAALWQEVGGYSTDVRVPGAPWGMAEDWEFWVKVFAAGHTAYQIVNEAIYHWRFHDGMLSATTDHGSRARQVEFRKVLQAKYPDLPWGLPLPPHVPVIRTARQPTVTLRRHDQPAAGQAGA